MQFIKIRTTLGKVYINVDRIISVEHIATKHEGEVLRVYTDQTWTGAGDDGTGSESVYHEIPATSGEGQALLRWLDTYIHPLGVMEPPEESPNITDHEEVADLANATEIALLEAQTALTPIFKDDVLSMVTDRIGEALYSLLRLKNELHIPQLPLDEPSQQDEDDAAYMAMRSEELGLYGRE